MKLKNIWNGFKDLSAESNHKRLTKETNALCKHTELYKEEVLRWKADVAT